MLILRDTASEISNEDPQQSIDFIQSGLQGVSRETLDSFLTRNAQPSQLSPEMQLGVDYILISSDELLQITRQPDWGNVLREKFPNSSGYTMLSRVGFNNALDQAVVYVGNMAGPLMGAGYYYLLEKKNGEWRIRQQVMVWIS
jgi:hypothetical protein